MQKEDLKNGEQEVKPPVEPELTDKELLEQMKAKADAADRALSDLQKQKARIRELEALAHEKDKADKAREEQMLEEQNNFKKLAEMRAEQLNEVTNKYENLNSNLLKREKLSALESVAMKMGIRDLNDVSSFGLDNEVVVETTSTGRLNVLGAEDVVKKLKQDKPYLFKSGGGSINSNEQGVVNTNNAITFESLEKARQKAETSGDYKEYEVLLNKYKAQSR